MGGVNSGSYFNVSFTNDNQIIDIESQDKPAFSIKCKGLNEHWQKVTFTNGSKTCRYAVKLVNGDVVTADANKHLRRLKSFFSCFFRDQSLFKNVKEKVEEVRHTHTLLPNSSQSTSNLPSNSNPKTPTKFLPSSGIKPESSPEITAVSSMTLAFEAEVQQKTITGASQIAPEAKTFCKTENPIFVFDLDDTLYVKVANYDGHHAETVEEHINDKISNIK
ncbi:hypothetical protein SOPP22_08005 [Shewanella sp. OPT22]|nr:hypothetical protein SOPP22_08005 [Shewanella sp. OPT22]